MGGGLRIGRIFGIPIYLHATWFVVFLLVTLSLSANLAEVAPEQGAPARWAVAGATSLLFFGSILLHELGHSVVALHHRVPVRSITLFIFGGVALMERDPKAPRAELEIAIAGPIASALLALLFAGLERAAPLGSTPATMLGWLARINGLVAAFNLLPGFPLDGGRLLRAFLWARSGDALAATRVSARVGQSLAYGFIGLGAVVALTVNPFSGMWLAFIGWFLLVASGASVRQASIDFSLRGLRARDVMSPDVAWIEASAPVGVFARELVMRGRRWALVGNGGAIGGIVTLSDAKRVAAGAWESTRVAEIATPGERVVTAAPGSPVQDLLLAMASQQVNQIPILERGRVLGAVTREGLVQAIQLRDAAGVG